MPACTRVVTCMLDVVTCMLAKKVSVLKVDVGIFVKEEGFLTDFFLKMQRSKKVLLLVVGGGINRLEELAKNNKI